MKKAKRIVWRVIWSVVLAYVMLIGIYYLVLYVQFDGRWWGKEYRLDTLTQTQTETLATYVGLPADAIQEVTDYRFDQGKGPSDNYVTFIAQIDEAEIQSLKERYDAGGYSVLYVSGERVKKLERGLYYSEVITYEISTKDVRDWVTIYVLDSDGGYYFQCDSPGEEICFTGSTDEG